MLDSRVETLNKELESRGLLNVRLPMRVRVFGSGRNPRAFWKKAGAKIMGFQNSDKGLSLRIYSFGASVTYRDAEDGSKYSSRLCQPRAFTVPVSCVRFQCGPSKSEDLWTALQDLDLECLRWFPSRKRIRKGVQGL